MSFKLKQRFGEVLALVLILTIVGFLVYILIPTNPKTPKSEPVTVRSATKIETQSHIVATTTDQAPPGSHALQETTAVNVQSVPSTVSNSSSGKSTSSKIDTQQQNSNSQSSIASANPKATCAPLPKTVAKVGSVLLSIPVVGSLITDVTNCAS